MTAPHTAAVREWVGEVRLSNGRYWRTSRVRVRAHAPHVAVRRALLEAKYAISALLRRPLRIAGIRIELTPVPRTRKGVRRETAV